MLTSDNFHRVRSYPNVRLTPHIMSITFRRLQRYGKVPPPWDRITLKFLYFANGASPPDLLLPEDEAPSRLEEEKATERTTTDDGEFRPALRQRRS